MDKLASVLITLSLQKTLLRSWYDGMLLLKNLGTNMFGLAYILEYICFFNSGYFSESMST